MTDEPDVAVAPAGTEQAAQETSDTPSPSRRRRRGGRGRGRGSASRATQAAAVKAEPQEAAAPDAEDKSSVDGKKPPPRRRRSRGGRGRRRTTAAKPETDKETAAETKVKEAEPEAKTADAKPKPRRRRGGRGRKPAAAEPEAGAEQAEKKPVEKPAAKTTTTRRRRRKTEAEKEPTSTRLSARRSTRRRREALPVVKRAQDKVMVITEHGERDQIAVLEGRELVQHYITRAGAHSMVGNMYMARVQNVLPGMEAAFLDIGRGRNAVLYAGEVNYDEDVEGPAPRIEQVLKSGQAVMVQVTKDPMGGKGARLTAQVSLPGRFLVLVPNSQVFGISRRLPDDERRRLRAAVKKVRPEEHGIIVRTAAEGASEQDLVADVDRLVKEWKQIEKKSKKVKAPALLYEEPELTVRVVRDLFNAEEFIEIATDSPSIYERVTGYLRDVAPDLLDRVHLREGPLPVFEQYHIVEQIHKALDRKVWLPSGGYIVIDRSEALTVIDVNTGKHVGKTNLEETVVQTNIEAAQEIARQLRLRDIGGMIVIDFIDMLLEKNKKQIVATMEEALAQDKTRSQVFDISPLGLLEVTRKRVSAGLLESFSETCPTCEGRGILLTLDV